MNIVEKLLTEIHRLKTLGLNPTRIYLGHKEYRNLRLDDFLHIQGDYSGPTKWNGLELYEVCAESHLFVI